MAHFLVKLVAIITLFITVIRAQVLTTQQQFCGVGQPCSLIPHNFLTAQSFSIPTTGVVATERFGIYKRTLVQSNTFRNNFILYTSGAAVNCAGGRSLLFNSISSEQPPRALANVQWIQLTSFACTTNFTNQIDTVDAQTQFMDLVIAMDNTVTVPALSITFKETWKPANKPKHVWTVVTGDATVYPVSWRPIKVSLNIQLLPGALYTTPAGCNPLASATANNMRLVFIHPVTGAINPSFCRYPVTSWAYTSPTTLRADFHAPMFSYLGCTPYTWAAGTFTAPLSGQVEMDPQCTYPQTMNYPMFNFTVQIIGSTNSYLIL